MFLHFLIKLFQIKRKGGKDISLFKKEKFSFGNTIFSEGDKANEV